MQQSEIMESKNAYIENWEDNKISPIQVQIIGYDADKEECQIKYGGHTEWKSKKKVFNSIPECIMAKIDSYRADQKNAEARLNYINGQIGILEEQLQAHKDAEIKNRLGIK
jgi:hypothetical protein